MDIGEIDLLDRDRFVEDVPHEWFSRLRREAPLYRHPEPNGPGFWVVTRYHDVVRLNRDWETCSSAQARGGVVGLEELEGVQKERAEAMAETGGHLMLAMDPPSHTRYRKLVNRGFTPRHINALEDHIRAEAAQIVEDAMQKDECDFVVDVAAELPLQAIAELLGVPMEDRHKLFDWSNRMVGSEDPEYAVAEDRLMEAQVEMFVYAGQLADERRREPRPDIVTTLLESDLEGDRLSEMDFNMFFLLLAVAGNETTRNAISHGMLALAQHPEQYGLLVEDPSRATTATEEVLRWASPVMYFRRNATRDAEVHGTTIRTGDKVALYYISANRDEDVFDDPFTFDVLRSPNEHIAFGGGGPHFCLGASLARLEIRVLFEELAKRVARVELAGPVERLRSNFINGIKHMPVRLVPHG